MALKKLSSGINYRLVAIFDIEWYFADRVFLSFSLSVAERRCELKNGMGKFRIENKR